MARARRDELVVELGRDRRWSVLELADAASVSDSQVKYLLRRAGLPRRRPLPNAEELAELDGAVLRELRAIGRIPRGVAGDAARARRDVLLEELWESDPSFWSSIRLGVATGVGREAAGAVIRRCRARRKPAAKPQLPASDLAESRADRAARYRAEAEVSDDPRVARVLELGRWLGGLRVFNWDEDLRRSRTEVLAERARLVLELRAVDSQFWTLARLAAVLNSCEAKVASSLRDAQQDFENVADQSW